MAYCTNCGHELELDKTHCEACGKEQMTVMRSEHRNRHAGTTRSFSDGENSCNALAYILPMFWVPLLVYPNSPKARHNANQGLWLLITTTITALLSGVLYVGFALATGVVNLSSLHLLFMGSFAWDYISSNLFLLLPTAINTLFVVVSGIVGFVRSMQGKMCRIPGFGRLRLISE